MNVVAAAPVVLFIYKRMDHLDATLSVLKSCDGIKETPIIVFGDGPRSSGELDAVEAARRVAQQHLGSRAEYHFSDTNSGLSASLITGIDSVVKRFGRVIVVEDDLSVSPNFLNYMNAALDKYQDEKEVFQVSGHMFDVPEFRTRDTAMFLPFITTWGWATWSRSWAMFDRSAMGWERLKSDCILQKRFNLDGNYDYSAMLAKQMSGRGDSWGIRWYWSVFRVGGLSCFPPVSLVRNTGMDGSGTHGRGLIRRFGTHQDSAGGGAIKLPNRIAVDDRDFASVQRAIWRQNGGWVGALADRGRRGLDYMRGTRK